MKNEKGMENFMNTHAIRDASWCISGERLEYLLQTAEELGLKFYRFQDLQDE